VTKRAVVLVLSVLLLSYLPILGEDDDRVKPQQEGLEYSLERVEISPDPNSIRSLGSPSIYDGPEDSRQVIAHSSIGTYSLNGLIPSTHMDHSLEIPRSDLAIALVDGQTGLWDARMDILQLEGISIRSTIPPSGFLIQGSHSSLVKLNSLESVVSIHDVPSGLLVHPSLRHTSQQFDLMIEVIGWKGDDMVRLENPGLGLDDSLHSVAPQMTDAWSPEPGVLWGKISSTNISEIISHPSVSYISPLPILVLHNDQARVNMGINSVENAFITGLNGSGQIVAVGDSGLDNDHGDFTGRISGITSVTPGDSSTADPSDGHGTHVACTVLGSGFRSSGGYKGIAPEADLYFQAMEDDDSGALYSYGINSMLNSAYNAGARIHTNSWGSTSGFGGYSTQSEDADDRTSTWDQYWSYDGMTVLFAAGNERDDGVSPPGTAKNVITVGGHKNRYSGAPDEMYYWSSRGPTDDGRIKPDLVAPGDYVRSCKAQEASSAGGTWSNTWYMEYSGTSMATPAAAGSSALVREYLTEVIGRQAPQGSLIKALLILGAKDMGSRDIPNNDEGWGRVDLVESLIPDGEIGIFVDDRSRIKSGQVVEYTFDVNSPGNEFKAVLAWSDYPGSSSSSIQLRNDLDLELISPDGITYKGNVFTNGRSSQGGTKDSVNNVEVVALDSTAQGIWTIRVTDSQHGGSRTWQPFSIAVRGHNVNDLSADPTFVPDSMNISTPIPQVGEDVEVSVLVKNLGAGSIVDVPVIARVNSAPLGEQLVSLSPGETVELMWTWSPESEGDAAFEFFIDPNNQFDEMSDSNNYLGDIVIVSAPGVRVSAQQDTIILVDTSSTTSTWDLTLTNTALFETNATISATSPVRIQDGTQFGWFQSFTSNTFNLMPAEQVSVGMTMVHPAPPPPGIYSMTLSGYDLENDIQSDITLYFEVPVLADADIQLLNEQILVNPFDSTSTQITIVNDGNGAQSYDVELVSPAGWHLGLDSIGTFEGSSHGSTGTLQKDSSRTVDITINPPGAMIPAGTTFEAAIILHSRVSSVSWTQDIFLIVGSVDEFSLSPQSGEVKEEISPDSLLLIDFSIENIGNRDWEMTPYLMTVPGGWNVVGPLSAVTVPAGQTVLWSMELQGNGIATSGLIEIRLATSDGFRIDWNTTIEVLSAASPQLMFNQVFLPDGSSSDEILGVGSHPVGEPGFDLHWMVWNEGSGVWRPTTVLDLPNQEWSSSCSSPSSLAPGESDIVECLVVIPDDEPAGSEPIITLIMEGDGIEIRDTKSLLVEDSPRLSWTLQTEPIAHEGYTSSYRISVTNTGNSDVSHTFDVEAPESWNARAIDGVRIVLSPGESRSVILEFTPNSGSDSTISINLINSQDFEGSTFEIPVDVMPSLGSNSDLGDYLPFILGTLLIAVFAALGTYAYVRTNGDPLSMLNNKTQGRRARLNDAPEMDSTGVPCWICSTDVSVGNALACSSCGARYHKQNQVNGCDIISMGRCLHCDADVDELVEA
tara:strand:+ start:5058 stop:9542 length:4485 start_codon:yes stop_codon:yes gene_type:complete